ncbi:MAG: alpha/beta fold hydrolase [Acidimicrobiia bacterium]|nr:alpha/beta fold hydrolase [Acidimicrobiia bacterium]
MSISATIGLATERLLKPIEGMHRAISSRWFDALEPVARPVRLIHDGITRVVYGSIRLGGSAAGHGLAGQFSQPSHTVDEMRAVANGLWGDDLGRHEVGLAIPMTLRDVITGIPHHPGVRSSGEHLVVLVHGLFETERIWHATETRPGLIEYLEEVPGLTTVSIRYNTGLPIAANGSRLASLITDLASARTVPPQSITLVGHSMGGLVVRNACTIARRESRDWMNANVDVITIGAPHRGSPIEKLVNTLTWGLGFARETRPLADFLKTRSAGVKAMRFGEYDPGPADPDALFPRGTAPPLPEGVNHYFIAGSVTKDPSHPIGKLLGDLVVRSASANAGDLNPTMGMTIGGLKHVELVHDAHVISHIRDIVTASHDA